jgi:hypothetical protein
MLLQREVSNYEDRAPGISLGRVANGSAAQGMHNALAITA